MRLSRNDIRLAARSFIRHPGFTSVAVLSLALGIALNTTMYSVIDAMVAPKSDIENVDRVYGLTIWGDGRRRVDQATRASLLATGFNTYEATTFSISWDRFVHAVEYGRRYAEAAGSIVAPNYFQVLGIRPVAGRFFIDDDVTGGAQPVVISTRLAERLFLGEASPLGKVIDVDGELHTIIGLRQTLSPNDRTDIWTVPPTSVPLSSIPPNIVRLREGIPVEDADKQLHALSARFAALAGEPAKDAWFQLVSFTSRPFHLQNFQYALIAAVGAVLLIACANLANLQIARGIGRGRELAVRAALGATRRDIIRQLVLESGMLAAAGLVAGLLLTFWGVHLLGSRIPPSVGEYVIAPQTSWRVMAFAAAACLLCVMLIGLLPAIHVSRVDPNELLKSGAGTGAHRKSRLQYGMMVVLEVGLALAVLSGAGIVVRRALFVTNVRTEYDTTPLSHAWMWLRPEHDTTIRRVNLANQLLSRVRGLPDVADAAVYYYEYPDSGTVTMVEASGVQRQIEAPMYSYRVVSPSYLRTLGIPVVKGRDFLDGTPSAAEVIIDQPTAARLWPGEDAVGKQLKLGQPKSKRPWVRIVGVLRPSNNLNLDFMPWLRTEKGARLGAIYYLPAADDSFQLHNRGTTVNVAVRSAHDHERMPITLKRSFQHSGGSMRLLSAERLEVTLGIRRERESHAFVAATFITFATLAVGLAALGIYGIVAHSVAERRRELGVRIALGASTRNILNAVLREGNAMALAGVALGLIFTRMTAEWLMAFSFEDDKYNAPLFAAMGIVLFIVAVCAALVPASRATRIDPVESMRCE